MRAILHFFRKQPLAVKLSFYILAIFMPIFYLISTLYLRQFEQALELRILDQLHSIRLLKASQTAQFLDLSSKRFSEKYKLDPDSARFKVLTNGHDSLLWTNGSVELAIGFRDIEKIFIQRGGMGESGESYLVAPNHVLITPSRFVDSLVRDEHIVVETEPARMALDGIDSSGIYDDYRGIKVFSSFGPFKYQGLTFGLMSEIDVHEGTLLLDKTKRDLMRIFIPTVLVLLLSSILIGGIFTIPFRKLKSYLQAIQRQEYDVRIKIPDAGPDVRSIFEVLSELTTHTNQAIQFARNLEYGKLDVDEFDFGSGAGLALVKMREDLLHEKQKTDDIRKQTSLLLRNAEDQERLRLARDLHDGLGPLLTYLKMQLSNIQTQNPSVQEAMQILDEIIQEIRNISSKLLPSAVVDVGLIPAMESHLSRIKNDFHTRFDVHEEVEESQVPNEVKVAVFRIFQELVNNAVKHASCQSIHVSISVFEGHLSVSVADDGVGIPENQEFKGKGLRNIHERAELLGGQVEMKRTEKWTIFDIEIPFKCIT